MPWIATLIIVLVLQVVLATLVWYDARRRSIEHAFGYWYGIMVPLAGYLVFVVYLGRRGRTGERRQ